MLGGGSLANDAVLVEEDGHWAVQGDPTDAAFLVAEGKLGITERRRARFRRLDEVLFTSERKLMSTVEVEADRERGGRVAVVTKGAPDVLLARCAAERVGAGTERLTEERRAEGPGRRRPPGRGGAADPGRRLPAPGDHRAAGGG